MLCVQYDKQSYRNIIECIYVIRILYNQLKTIIMRYTAFVSWYQFGNGNGSWPELPTGQKSRKSIGLRDSKLKFRYFGNFSVTLLKCFINVENFSGFRKWKMQFNFFNILAKNLYLWPLGTIVEIFDILYNFNNHHQCWPEHKSKLITSGAITAYI